MKFHLVDRIESIEPGRRIVTTKALSLAEEYLADHFPAFPVLPGVLILESAVQAAAWLTRIAQDYSRSIIVLQRAKNVRYSWFVAPGNLLRCELEAKSIADNSASFKATAYVGDRQTLTARLELSCRNLADEKPWLAGADEAIRAEMRKRFSLVHGPEALAAAANA